MARKRRRTKRKSNRPARRRQQPDNKAVTPQRASSGGFAHKIGKSLGGAVGGWAGKQFKSLTGLGDYSEAHAESGLDVEANSIVQPMTSSQVPIFDTPEHLHGAVRVRHREFIKMLDTTKTDLISERLRINPTNRLMFPWLSTLALNFEQWLPMGIVFEFVSTCGNAFSGTSAALGDVSMATQYDILAPGFTDRSSILNHFFSTSGATSQNLMHAVECAPGDTPCLPRYCQAPAVTVVTADTRLNDLGLLAVLTGGSQDIYTAGQLWVTYEIILMKPRLQGLIPGMVHKFSELDLCRLAEEHPDLPRGFLNKLANELVEQPESKAELEVDAELDDWVTGKTLNGEPPTAPKTIGAALPVKTESIKEALKRMLAEESANPPPPPF